MGQGRFFFLLLLAVASIAVPISKKQRRIKRDENSSTNTTIHKNVCILDEQTYENGQEVPSLGPCEKCVCEAPDVICSMIKCQPNSGCRILQQSGQCCPEYKCDCEYNGIVYNNGERLDKPEDPCQVCYCKGGEIMCTSITCYERDDCQPHYTAGQCCPRYDHCPVETSRASGNSVRSVNTSLYSPKREMQPWPLTKPNSLTSVSYEESSASPNIYPQTIRIVEILPTTPGSESKPSEVSVIPRIKTNDHGGSKESEEISKEVSTTASSPEYSLITSEVEHLLETTPETKEVKSEATTASSSSTLNPLAESVDLNTLPDSYRMSTVYPDYYHTEGNLNLVEDDTTNAWNETEGSGYELLKGGIYEESSTLAPLLNSNQEIVTENIYTTTNIPSDFVNINEHKNEELRDKISDLPTFEAYTATEATTVSDEYNSNSTEYYDDENGSECNSTSLEVSSSTAAPTTKSGSSESNENDSESVEDSNEHFNTKNRMENLINQTATSDNPIHQSSSEANAKTNTFDENIIVTSSQSDEVSTTVQPITSTMAMTGSDVSDETSTLVSKSEIFVTTEGNNKETTMDFSEASTEPSEIFLISQTPDENKAETKRAVVGYRNLDSDIPEIDEYHYPSRDETSDNYGSSKADNTFTTPSLISIPPVLNVNSLSYGDMGHKLENNTNHNASSMAKVGIYHPTNPHFASFVTVVDDKINASTFKNGSSSTHMLLTPNDLKKLAEIIIHQKIKPVYLDRTTDASEVNSSQNPPISKTNENEISQNNASVDGEYINSTPNPVEGIVANADNAGQNVPSSHDHFNRALSNEESSTTRISADVDPNAGSITESSVPPTTFRDIIKNIVSTVPNDPKVPNQSEIDDPNTSRQIRIPENSNQYSALLDDKDLVILENFFKKNMGLH